MEFGRVLQDFILPVGTSSTCTPPARKSLAICHDILYLMVNSPDLLHNPIFLHLSQNEILINTFNRIDRRLTPKNSTKTTPIRHRELPY
jgi:hypothetical protein